MSSPASAARRTPAPGAGTGVAGGPASAAATGTTVHFTQAARLLSREARRRGLVAPGFRCPPRVVGVQRTLRRHASGAVVAVQVRGRPWGAVVADMIEGVVVANRLVPPAADRLRTELWEAIGLEWPADLSRVA
ncbi:MAG: hypothetical protein NTZ21_15910 [Actinobacteria bacterium]|nr:hypothetical protein [Actinomycetota bacterium]